MTAEDPSPAGRARTAAVRWTPVRASRGSCAQFVRFCLVGAAGYLANVGAFTVLVDGARVPALAAACLAYAVGWVVAFAGHRSWTFARPDQFWAHQGLRYFAVSALMLAVNLGILHALLSAGVEAVLSQALAVACITPVSFLLNRGWAFR